MKLGKFRKKKNYSISIFALFFRHLRSELVRMTDLYERSRAENRYLRLIKKKKKILNIMEKTVEKFFFIIVQNKKKTQTTFLDCLLFAKMLLCAVVSPKQSDNVGNVVNVCWCWHINLCKI